MARMYSGWGIQEQLNKWTMAKHLNKRCLASPLLCVSSSGCFDFSLEIEASPVLTGDKTPPQTLKCWDHTHATVPDFKQSFFHMPEIIHLACVRLT